MARVGLVGLGVVVPFLVLELAFRLLGPILPGEYATATFEMPSALLGRQNKPDTAGWRRTSEFTTWVRVNSKGLRGPEIDYARPPDTYRILVLGDSFTFAMQVAEEETFVARLAARLEEARPGSTPRIQTINAGTDGWSTANEYAWLTTEGYRYQPDLVLLMFFVGNDPGDNADQVEGRDGASGGFGLTPVSSGGPLAAAREGLSRVSRVYSFFELGVLAKLHPPAAEVGPLAEARSKEQRHLDAERKARGWAISESLLRRLREYTEARGIKLAVVGIPTMGQVIDPGMPGTPLAGISQRAGLREIELVEPFRTQPSRARQRLYFPENQHWTADGHDLAARVVAARLIDWDLLPDPSR